jgi:hypothetical protein
MEPETKYGHTITAKLVVPRKDLDFAKELIQRLGWNIKEE